MGHGLRGSMRKEVRPQHPGWHLLQLLLVAMGAVVVVVAALPLLSAACHCLCLRGASWQVDHCCRRPAAVSMPCLVVQLHPEARHTPVLAAAVHRG